VYVFRDFLNHRIHLGASVVGTKDVTTGQGRESEKERKRKREKKKERDTERDRRESW
jgi:hypothetical protein